MDRTAGVLEELTVISLALMSILKELKPRIDFETIEKNGINETAAKLIFDDALFADASSFYEYVADGVVEEVAFLSHVPNAIKDFFREYSTIRNAESQGILSSDMIKTLETELMKKYRDLPKRPAYPKHLNPSYARQFYPAGGHSPTARSVPRRLGERPWILLFCGYVFLVSFSLGFSWA